MRNKGTFMGGFSGALLKENLKRQWYLPLIIFMLYFLSGIFPLLFLGSGAGEYAKVSLNNANFIYSSFMTYIPIVVSCIMMWYLHKPEKAFALHAQPYSRGKLFNTHILLGWLMIVIPVILTGAIYMCFSGSLTVTDWNTEAVSQAFTVKDAAIWVLNSISIYTFCYGLCVLAGSIVGNTVTQVLGSLVFYNLVPALMGTGMLYSTICLPGYDEPSQTTWEILLNSDPQLGGLVSFLAVGLSGNTDATELGMHMIAKGWYFILGLIFIMIAKYAIYKGKLEKVGDSMIFRPVEAVVTVVITFIGGALLGALFGLINNDGIFIFLGAILGGGLAFFLVKLILERTPKIFYARNLKILAISIVILVVFIAVFVFDLTGYAGRVPEADRIKTVDAGKLMEISLDNGDVSDQEEIYFKQSFETEDRGYIGKVNELHKYITENKLYLFDENEGTTEICDLNFIYTLDSGRTFKRVFRISPDEHARELIAGILGEEVTKQSRMIPEEFKDAFKYAEISQDIYKNEGYTNRYANVSGAGSKEDISRFIDAYNNDKMQEKLGLDSVINQIYVDSADGYTTEPESEEYNKYTCIDIYYENEKVEPRYEGDMPSVTIRIINDNDQNAQAVLEEMIEKYLVNEDEFTDEGK